MDNELPRLVLDACTNSMNMRVRAFADDYETIMRDFQKWAKDNHIKPRDMWYADIFDFSNAKHLAYLTLEDDGAVYLSGAPEDSKINPFKRKLGFRRTLKTLYLKLGALIDFIFFHETRTEE